VLDTLRDYEVTNNLHEERHCEYHCVCTEVSSIYVVSQLHISMASILVVPNALSSVVVVLPNVHLCPMACPLKGIVRSPNPFQF